MFKISDLVVVTDDVEDSKDIFTIVRGLVGQIVDDGGMRQKTGEPRYLVQFNEKVYKGNEFKYLEVKGRYGYCGWIDERGLRPAEFKDIIRFKCGFSYSGDDNE